MIFGAAIESLDTKGDAEGGYVDYLDCGYRVAIEILWWMIEILYILPSLYCAPLYNILRHASDWRVLKYKSTNSSSSNQDQDSSGQAEESPEMNDQFTRSNYESHYVPKDYKLL